MAQIIQKISVEVSKPNFFQAIVAKQFDSKSRYLKATLVHNGNVVEIDPNSTVTINAKRSDGADDRFAGEVNNDNTVTVPLTSWMLELVGTVKCDISVYGVDGSKLTTTSFVLEVEEASSDNDDVSVDENYDVLIKLIEDVGKITPDLTYDPESEQAQSGKAVAEAIDGFEERIRAEEMFSSDDKFVVISENQSRNMFDSSKVESGWLVDGGTIYNQASWVTSDYIPITENLAYTLCYWNEASTKVSYIRPRKICLYDENKEYIVGSYQEGTSLPYSGVFTGASYVRFSIVESNKDIVMLLLDDTSISGITEYIPYGNSKIYTLNECVRISPNRKIIAAGDSITYGSKQAGSGYADMTDGVSYMTMACECLGYELDNYSISSSTLGLKSDGSNPHEAFIERYMDMDDNADLVYIAMGTNDWFYQYDLGAMSDRVKTTFYGALHLLCQGLKDKYPSIPIIFATPIKRYIIRSGSPAGHLNLKSQELNLWRNAIKEVCEYHSIPVVDMYAESYLNSWEESERDKYIPDGTHPNGAGHGKMQITCEATLNKYLGGIYPHLNKFDNQGIVADEISALVGGAE